MPRSLGDNFVSVTIDLRFDQPGDRTSRGFLVNSYAAVKPLIDSVKSQGFNAVILQTNTPVNLNTGGIDTFAEEDPTSNKDKSLPDDFWKIAQYAKSVGLKVLIEPEIVNHVNDEHITMHSRFAPGWSWNRFFTEVAQYQQSLAREAEKYQLDGFYIGVMQHGLLSEQYRSGWQHIVDSVRSVFGGSLIHTSNYNDRSVVWEMVDYVSLYTNPILSRSAMTDFEQIYQEYFVADTDTPMSYASAVQQNHARYNKPIIIDAVSIAAGDRAVGDIDGIPNLFYSGQGVSGFRPNPDMQTARYKAVFELAASMKNTVVGVGVDGYSPWQQASWIRNPDPDNAIGQRWNEFAKLTWDLYYAPQTVASITPILKRGYNNSTLKYGSSQDDVVMGQSHDETLRGLEGNDVLLSKTGNDTMWGGSGSDRFVFDTKLNPRSNLDTIMDFDPAHDAIVLSKAIFPAIRSVDLMPNQFVTGIRALDRDDRIIFDPQTKSLWYDANGSAGGKSVKICHINLVGNSDLTYQNFDLI